MGGIRASEKRRRGAASFTKNQTGEQGLSPQNVRLRVLLNVSYYERLLIAAIS
jgi:hypothetical protein